MKGWVIFIVLVLIAGYLYYFQPEFTGKIIDTIKEKIGKIQTKLPVGTEQERSCKAEINEMMDFLRKKAPPTSTIELVDFKTFDSKIDALDYARLWTQYEYGIKDINTINKTPFYVGVVKITVEGFFCGWLVESGCATNPTSASIAVCDNEGKLMENTKEFFK